jgi:CSLREA domain-containing protein
VFSRLSIAFTSLVFLAALAAALVFLLRPASAAPFPVTKTADTNDGVCDADCSLREAIIAANLAVGADIITLPVSPYSLTIGGANENLAATGDLDITGDLTINGAGPPPPSSMAMGVTATGLSDHRRRQRHSGVTIHGACRRRWRIALRN